MSAENLARGERMHVEALAEHQSALHKEQGIDARIADIAKRMNAISQRRIAGTSNDQEAAEFAALGGDSQLLTQMLAAAKAETKLAGDKVRGAVAWYGDAQNAHMRQQAELEYNALQLRTKEIEAVFVRAIGATARAGKAIGHHSLSQSFKISETLHRAINLGVIPPQE